MGSVGAALAGAVPRVSNSHPATPKGAVIWSEGDVPKCTSAAGDDLLDPAWSLWCHALRYGLEKLALWAVDLRPKLNVRSQ